METTATLCDFCKALAITKCPICERDICATHKRDIQITMTRKETCTGPTFHYDAPIYLLTGHLNLCTGCYTKFHALLAGGMQEEPSVYGAKALTARIIALIVKMVKHRDISDGKGGVRDYYKVNP